jgi:hypothetical protein
MIRLAKIERKKHECNKQHAKKQAGCAQRLYGMHWELLVGGKSHRSSNAARAKAENGVSHDIAPVVAFVVRGRFVQLPKFTCKPFKKCKHKREN